MDILIILLLLGGLVWFWMDSLNARERAILAAKQACEQINVQLLDQTVAMESIKLRRNKQGRLVLYRIYGFEFSTQGMERRRGRTFILGELLEQIQLDMEQGMVIDER